jgi:hypothetical protein
MVELVVCIERMMARSSAIDATPGSSSPPSAACRGGRICTASRAAWWLLMNAKRCLRAVPWGTAEVELVELRLVVEQVVLRRRGHVKVDDALAFAGKCGFFGARGLSGFFASRRGRRGPGATPGNAAEAARWFVGETSGVERGPVAGAGS